MQLDDSLRLLSDENARKILYTARDLENPSTYNELVDEIKERDLMGHEGEERFKIAMEHNYLPRMAETGIIDYDSQSESVRYVQDDQVEELLELLEGMEPEDEDLV